MKTIDLRKLTKAELIKELQELKKEHFKLRMQLKTGQLTRNRLIRAVKRNIARVKTIAIEKTREQ